MRRLQAQGKAMQSLPRQNPDEAMRQLEGAIKQQLGVSARYMIAGDRVTVTLINAPAAALAQWLSQVRTNARAIPGEARLTRNASGGWDGSVVLTLPAR
jgi:general secretion pathway protein M